MTRLIDADALYENLGFAKECKDCDHQYNSVFCESSTWQVVCDAIYEAPTIDAVPQWIPCEERLPKLDEICLVTEKDGSIRHCYFDSADPVLFATFEEGMYVRNVVAWMPLPEPYEEEMDE